MEFSKYGPAAAADVLINCTIPVNTAQNPVACVRGIAPPRPTSFYLTYHTKDASGNPAVIADGSEGDNFRKLPARFLMRKPKRSTLRPCFAATGGSRGGFGGGGGAARGGWVRTRQHAAASQLGGPSAAPGGLLELPPCPVTPWLEVLPGTHAAA